MSDFIFRTEDMRVEDIMDYYVETQADRDTVDAIKGKSPIILVGSRGVGKSYLLRVAEQEMTAELSKGDGLGVLAVYVTFTESTLISSSDPLQFRHWMLARLCTYLLRALRKTGLITASSNATLSILSAEKSPSATSRTRIEDIAKSYEDSWQQPGMAVDFTGIPSVDNFKEAIEDLCGEINIRRVSFLIDEAAHILLPAQQREFFTLFRDLRSAYISCNAAVYQGVTVFGKTFQPVHDATMKHLERDVLSDTYTRHMLEIVEKQADSALMTGIARQKERFALLAYAANGNPRILLRTLEHLPAKMDSREVNGVIREYYRNNIWSEYSGLAEKYPAHQVLIDWGRRFIEEDVLPELQRKNIQYLAEEKKTSCFFWISRDAPQPVKEALRLLAYVGIVSEHADGIKATRGAIGTRYAVNLGCLLAREAVPTDTGFLIAKSLTPKRMSEYGANHQFFADIVNHTIDDSSTNYALTQQLGKPLSVLDIAPWLHARLQEIGVHTVGDILIADEAKLKEAHYVGEKRARRTRNAALAAVFEFLAG